jgi:hypothetical protein
MQWNCKLADVYQPIPKMRFILPVVFLICFTICDAATPSISKTKHDTCHDVDSIKNQPVKNGLRVSLNKNYLTDAVTNKPVFILATTAWNINALTYGEIDTLLQATAKHGFNSIMFCLDFYPQADEANVYGQRAYIGADKTELNPAYFTYCDYIINKCTKLGLYPMIYTMWSGKTAGIMNTYTTQQLYALGKKIGARYKAFKNVILVAGGESSPPYIDTAHVNAMGNGLKTGSAGNNLVAVHPCAPHSSSEFYASQNWVDFYMCQAKSNLGGLSFDLTKAITKDYNTALKPTIIAEHRYESGVSEDPIIQRRSLYLSVFAGGFGYAYGHNALWQMTPHTAQPWMLKSWNPGVKNWKEVLDTKAANQLQHIKKLLYTYPYLQRIPDQSLLLSAPGDSIVNKVEVVRDGNVGKNDASFIMAYISSPREVIVKTDVMKAVKLNAYWFNTSTGHVAVIQRNFINTGKFTSSVKTDGKDWVLVIDDAGKKYTFNQ